MRFPVRFLPSGTKIDFMGKRWLGFAASFLLVIGTFASIAVQGFNYGIDFTGGVLIEAKTEQAADLGVMRADIGNLKLGSFSLQNAGDARSVIIRIQAGSGENQAKVAEKVKEAVLASAGGKAEFRKVDYVGPQVGAELIRGAAIALVLSFAAIMLYIWFRFEWQYGVGGILALMHDATLMLGFYSVTRIEFDLTSVAAVLTVVGYSINDSVVIYDRIRENMRKYKKMDLSGLINLSLNETLSRTIITASTVLLATVGLVTLGGEVLKSFSAGMLFGVVIGTYSSIYVSAPVLIYTGLRGRAEEQQPAGVGA